MLSSPILISTLFRKKNSVRHKDNSISQLKLLFLSKENSASKNATMHTEFPQRIVTCKQELHSKKSSPGMKVDQEFGKERFCTCVYGTMKLPSLGSPNPTNHSMPSFQSRFNFWYLTHTKRWGNENYLT